MRTGWCRAGRRAVMRGCGSWCSLWTMGMNPRKIVLPRQCFVKPGKGWVNLCGKKAACTSQYRKCRLLLPVKTGLSAAFDELVHQFAGVGITRTVGGAEFGFAIAFKAHHAVLYGFFRQGNSLFAGEDVRTLACADLGEFVGNTVVEAAGFFQIKIERAALYQGLAHVSLVVDLAHRLGNGDEGQAEQQGGEQFFHHGFLVWVVRNARKIIARPRFGAA